MTKYNRRIHVIHKENAGVSVARNTGIDAAHGEWIAFIDADDEVAPEYISSLYEGTQKEDCDLSLCNINDYFPDKISPRREIGKPLTGDFRQDYHKLIDILRGPVVKLFKKRIIDEYALRFPVGIALGEDQVFNFTYYKHVKSYSFIDDGLYKYYHYSIHSLSKSFLFKGYCDNINKLQYEKDFLYSNDIANASIVLNNSAMRCLAHFCILSDRENGYDKFLERWYDIKKFVDLDVPMQGLKKQVLYFLLRHDLLCVVYFYHIIMVLIKEPERRKYIRCTPPPVPRYQMRRIMVA